MADAPPPPPPAPPVAIRITRPYDSEEEYLAQELEMISKTSITLVGAQPRPQGVVLRFELVLAGGAVLVRGEGRVVGFKPNAHRGVGGLTLRFTRIDARSKALLDKATAMRELRRPSSKPPKEALADIASALDAAATAAPPFPLPLPPPPPPEPEAPAPVVMVMSMVAQVPMPAAVEIIEPPVEVPVQPPVELPAAPAAAVAAHAAVTGVTAVTGALPERDSLLERLRTRAKGLQPDVVRGILEQRRRGNA